jgi:DNA-binding NarL/FixJ family response regulator
MPTLLLIDDHDGVREVLRLHAENRGFTVVGEATDGREAVDMAARLQPDVVIIDQDMPYLTGLETLPRLRRRVPHAVIVFYASGPLPETADRALELGAYAYFDKRESPKALLNSIVEIVRTQEAAPHDV